MSEFQITCIVRPETNRTHEAITHVGGPGGGGWVRTRAQIVQLIESKTDVFFTALADGRKAYVGVVSGASGKYLRTYADGVWNDNLLALPPCPQAP